MSVEEEKAIEHRFNIFEADRHFHVNSKNEPNIFNFTIESIGVLTPRQIFLKAIEILINKLKIFLKNLKNDNDIVTIKNSNNLQNTIDIHVLNDNHTLGNLIQSHFNYYDDLKKENFCKDKDIINYIGYYEPHPLDDKIVLRIGLTNEYLQKQNKTYDYISDIKNNIIDDCINKLIRLCNDLYSSFEKL